MQLSLLLAKLALPLVTLGEQVKVVILAGQSNMEGKALASGLSQWDPPWAHPVHGSLAHLAEEARTTQLFSQASCLEGGWRGGWAVLENVKVWMHGKDCPTPSSSCDAVTKSGNLTVGFGLGGLADRFGPELGLGFGLANGLPGERFLLLKLAYGGSSLAKDWRPPSSVGVCAPPCPQGTCEPGCAGLGDSLCDLGVGPNFERLLVEVRAVMAPGEVARRFPELAGLTPKLAGFVWSQSWTDEKQACLADEYAANLANLVQDLRAALNAPGLPAVVAVCGFFALGFPGRRRASECARCDCSCQCDEDCSHLKVAEQQLSLRGRVANLVVMETRGFWRAADLSPPRGESEPYHYYFNAEPYFLQGQALAAGLLQLLGEAGTGAAKDLDASWLAFNELAFNLSVQTPQDLWPSAMAPRGGAHGCISAAGPMRPWMAALLLSAAMLVCAGAAAAASVFAARRICERDAEHDAGCRGSPPE